MLERFGKALGWLGGSTVALAAKEGIGDTFSSHGTLMLGTIEFDSPTHSGLSRLSHGAREPLCFRKLRHKQGWDGLVPSHQLSLEEEEEERRTTLQGQEGPWQVQQV